MEVETRPIYWQTMGIIIGPISQRDCTKQDWNKQGIYYSYILIGAPSGHSRPSVASLLTIQGALDQGLATTGIIIISGSVDLKVSFQPLTVFALVSAPFLPFGQSAETHR